MRGQARQIGGWTLAAAATYVAVFLLPYRFPLRESVLSETWVSGANNQVAALLLALVSATVLLVCWLQHDAPTERIASRPLGRRYPIAAIAVATAWTATLGSAVQRAGLYWGDQGYFLNQLRSGLIFHQAIYRQFEFAYGPALYLWPAMFLRALAPLGISFATAYLISLALLEALGLGLLFYTIEALPLPRTLRMFAFILISFATLNALLGLNYTLFRFILPCAAVVLLSRQKNWQRAAAVAGLSEMSLLAVSPELGFAFMSASLAVAAYRAYVLGFRWLLVAFAAFAGATLFIVFAGRDYFASISSMVKGGYNLLLTPVPHILVLLTAVVVLAPLAVARMLRQDKQEAALGLGLYAAALGMLPAALGRCDPIHVFCNGIGFYLLSFLALDRASPRWRNACLIALTLAFAMTQVKNIPLYRERFALIVGIAQQHPMPFDKQGLLTTLAGRTLSAPMLAPQPVIDELTRTGQYVPGYFCGWSGVWDSAAEQRKIADMRRTRFALVALSDPVSLDPNTDRRLDRWMRLGLANHPQRPPFARDALLAAELKSNWKPLGIYGDYVLFEQI